MCRAVLQPIRLGDRPRIDRAGRVVDPDRARPSGAAPILLSLFALTASAASDDGAKFFQAGRAAFEQQDYVTALDSFEHALDAGMTGPAVHFNIGVAAYRLQRYERAELAFKEAARTPAMAPLAHYNLGLVALGAGDREAAIRWFVSAQGTSTDERLRELASVQLDTLAPQRSGRNWLAYGAVSAGYDDNVALVSNANVLGVSDISDYFTDLQLALSVPLDQPWRFDAALFVLDYQDLNEFDQWILSGGGRYRLSSGRWNHELGVQLSHTTLDDDGMENRYTFGLSTRTALPLEWQLRARYRFSDLDGLEQFESLSGTRHEIDTRVNRYFGRWNVLARYQFDINEYDDESLSSTRHFVALDVERAISSSWMTRLEVSWRRSDYDEDGGAEHRTEGALAVMRTLSSRWRLIMRYAYADNDSYRSDLEYQRSRVSATLEAVY